jgi:hypothetical protein
MKRVISKSKYVSGLQCLKYLWYQVNDPEAIPPFDDVTMFRFRQGHEVGNLAKSLFPGGIEIEHGVDIEAELPGQSGLQDLLLQLQAKPILPNISPNPSLSRHLPIKTHLPAQTSLNLLPTVHGTLSR